MSNQAVVTSSWLVIVALLVTLTGCHGKEKELYNDAQSLWLDKHYKESASKLTALVEESPTGPYASKALFRLGEIYYLNLNEPEDALDYFDRAIGKNDDRQIGLKSLEYKARIYMDRPDGHNMAITEYQKIIDRFADQVAVDEIRYKIGKTYFAKGEYGQAAVEFQTLIQQFPESPLLFDTRQQIANCLFIAGKPARALEEFEKLIAEAPDDSYDYDLNLSRAILLEEMERLDDALKAYSALIAKYPNRKLLLIKKESVEKRIGRNLFDARG
jgi:TolA-binding protein